jgi:DNA-binding Xre family transcriptional regulator
MTRLQPRLRVKDVAQERGISRAKLGRLSDLSDWTMRAVWKNPYYNIGLQTLARIARALDVSIYDLIEESPAERTGELMDE